MILHLAEHLEVPLRDRNALLLAGGYAPAYPERGLAEPELKAVQAALKHVLAGHEPYPAVVVNRWWELVDANSGIALFTRPRQPRPPPAAGQRAAAEPAPGRHGPADREPPRVAGPLSSRGCTARPRPPATTG